MERRTVTRALIIDERPRGGQFQDILESCGVTAEWSFLAVEQSGGGCGKGNLCYAQTGLPDVDVLFIHLGPLDAVRRRSDGDGDGARAGAGNECALEFYLYHRQALENCCVIAYSGGSGGAPAEFKKSHEPGWHQFFPHVMGAGALNIVPFIGVWRRCAGPPPLAVLTGRSDAAETLKWKISAYRSALRDRATATAERYAAEEQPHKWDYLLGEKTHGYDLADWLSLCGDAQASRMVALLENWLARVRAAGEGGAPVPFDEELRGALFDIQQWVPARERVP